MTHTSTGLHTYIDQALVLNEQIILSVGRLSCSFRLAPIMNWEVHVLFGHCLPSKEMLPVRFPEDTRRRTGTGGMVSSTARKEGGSNQIIHCKKGIVITTDSLLFQIQMSEHNSLLCGGELHDNLFLILSQLSPTLSYHLGS